MVARRARVSRLRAALGRAREAQRRRNRSRSLVGRLLSGVVCLVAGLMMVTSAIGANGTDLRPGRHTDLVDLVNNQSRQNQDLARQVSELRRGVDELARDRNQGAGPAPSVEEHALLAGLTPLVGPALTVTLDDAPDNVAAVGIDADLLVVHQQDIQAVVNALWSGGAEAMTIQGQRVIATTGIKCVGNTVVLHGIPYAPPYVVTALGDPARLRSALTGSRAVQIYQQYVDAYGLRYSERSSTRATFPAYGGSLDLERAQPREAPRAAPSTAATPR